MSMTTVPGYRGFVPNFQKEYNLTKNIPAHKYEDINIQTKDLMHGSTFRTNYQSAHKDYTATRTAPRSNLPTISKVEAEQKARDVYEYETRPTYWSTNYKDSHDGWKAHDNRSTVVPPAVNIENGPQHVCTGLDNPSSYTRSFGQYGHNPREHYVFGDGKDVLSRRATTKDLFMGTNKGSRRMIGYSGYVPSSHNNINTIRDNVPPDTKVNLLQTFNHNAPGYTGHKPQSVSNDRGQRNPIGKKPLKEGLHTGLMIDSMLRNQ